jgi:hypothetical protein
LSQEEAHLYDAGIVHLGYNFKPLWDSMGEAAFQASGDIFTRVKTSRCLYRDDGNFFDGRQTRLFNQRDKRWERNSWRSYTSSIGLPFERASGMKK